MAGHNMLKVAKSLGKPSSVRALSTSQCICSEHGGFVTERHYEREKIGNREHVGFGSNGQWSYVDRIDYPFPAIRFKEFKGPLQALREKEKGDWKNLSLEEKKELYRANFCQTYAEIIDGRKGEGWLVLASVLMISAICMWWYIWTEVACMRNNPGSNPKTMTREWQLAMTRRFIDQHQEPIWGISSKWDYDKKEWKK